MLIRQIIMCRIYNTYKYEGEIPIDYKSRLSTGNANIKMHILK